MSNGKNSTDKAGKVQNAQSIEIDSYLLLRYKRQDFLDIWAGEDKEYIIEISLTEGDQVMKAEVKIFINTQTPPPPQSDIHSYLRFTADVAKMKELVDFLEGSINTKLLHVIYGMTKKPVEHVLAIVPSENVGKFIVMSKGDRVAVKGDRIVIQDPKNGKVSVDV